MRHLHIDIETYSDVDIKKSGLYRYVQSRNFQVLLFGYKIDDEPVRIIDLTKEPLPDYIIEMLADKTVIKHAYNAAFEWYCLNKFYYSPIDQWRCNMAHSLYCGYPIGLAAAGEALGLPQDKRKMGIGAALIRLFCNPCKPTKTNGYRTRILPEHEPEKWELFKQYCMQDVVTEYEIEKRLSKFQLPDFEQKMWELDQVINTRGVAVDLKLVEGALYCSHKSTEQLTNEAKVISGISNPKSVKQLMDWLNKELEDEEVTDLQKATVSSLIDRLDNEKAKRMLEIRRELAKTSVRKYAAMETAVCADGRIRGLLQYYGANRTGRWAGRLVQVQNLPRNHLETLSFARECVINKKLDTLKVIYGNVPDTLSQLIRTALIPAKGHVFLVADFSAIEARVIAWLAGEQWRQEVFATHGKIYEASASAMFGVPIERIVKGNPEYELRQKGKIAELALGYQGSIGALKAMGASSMGLSDEELAEIVQRWRNANKRIVDLWYSIENAAIETVKTCQPNAIRYVSFSMESDGNHSYFVITLPSDRKLFYVKPFLSSNEFGKEAIYYYGVSQDAKKWIPLSTYGGKLVENIVQAVARDCLAESIKRLEAAGYSVVMHVHDEVIIEHPANTDTEAELKKVCSIMSQPLLWAPGLLLKADGFVTEYYKKE